jgi:uncharacterized membrane protein
MNSKPSMIRKLRTALNFSNTSNWGKFVRILFYGFLGGGYGLLIILARPIRTTQEVITYFVAFFSLTAYFAIVVSQKSIAKILATSGRWQKVINTIRQASISFSVWCAIPLLTAFLQSYLNSYVPIILQLWAYIFFVFLFLTLIYSLAIYIPSCQFVTSTKANVEKKKIIATALAVLTPMLGLPWFSVIYFSLLFAGISIPYYIVAIIILIVYLVVFGLFIDLPYVFTIKEKRKKEIGKLEKQKKSCYKNLKKITGAKATDVWGPKVVIELEIARYDREIKEIKSESVHPFKVTVPIAGLIFAAISPIVVDVIKNWLALGVV